MMQTVVLWIDLALLAVFAAFAARRIVVGERQAGPGGGPVARSADLRALDRRLVLILVASGVGAAVYLALGLN